MGLYDRFLPSENNALSSSGRATRGIGNGAKVRESALTNTNSRP